MSRFSVVQQAPPIEVFALTKAFTDDKFEKKVSLGVGGKDFLFYKFVDLCIILHNYILKSGRIILCIIV